MPSNRPKFNQQELLTLLIVMQRELELTKLDVDKVRAVVTGIVLEPFLDELKRQQTIVEKLEQLTAPMQPGSK